MPMPWFGMPACDEDRQHLLQRVVRGALVGAADRPVDGDAAGGLAPPGLGEGEHLGALRRRQAAAAGADEQLERALAFLDRDRMALAVVGRNAAGGVVGPWSCSRRARRRGRRSAGRARASWRARRPAIAEIMTRSSIVSSSRASIENEAVVAAVGLLAGLDLARRRRRAG